MLMRCRPLVVRSRAFLRSAPSSQQAAPHGSDARRRQTTRLVVAQGIQQIFIARDESLLLFFVELARNDVRLVIFKTETMQQCDQPRATFVDETELLFDPCADVARRARQRRADKHLQRVFSRGAQKARAPAHVEAGQAFNPALLEEFAPVANGVVVEKQRSGDVPATPSVVPTIQVRWLVALRERPPIHPAPTRSALRDPLRQGTASNHSTIRIRSAAKCKEIRPDSQ